MRYILQFGVFVQNNYFSWTEVITSALLTNCRGVDCSTLIIMARILITITTINIMNLFELLSPSYFAEAELCSTIGPHYDLFLILFMAVVRSSVL